MKPERRVERDRRIADELTRFLVRDNPDRRVADAIDTISLLIRAIELGALGGLELPTKPIING